MISTKGRYALRVMIDLTEQGDDALVPLKDIAKRQGISEKYLQHIVKLLVDKGLLVGVSGKGGGYRLVKRPEEYSVAEILEAAEGTLAPVACLSCDADICERIDTCKTISLWKRYDELSREFLSGISILELAEGDSAALREDTAH